MKIPDDELFVMEQAFLLQERRAAETLANTLNPMLGTGWDAEQLLGKPPEPEGFTWSLRTRTPRVMTPITMVLTQNPKFAEQLRTMAMDVRKQNRRDASVLNVPAKMLRDTEIVDLSFVPKDEFLNWARNVRHG